MKMPLDAVYRDNAVYAAEQAAKFIAKEDVYMAMAMLGKAQQELALAMTWGRLPDAGK